MMVSIGRRQLLMGAAAGAWLAVCPAAFADIKDLEQAARKEGEITWYVASLDGEIAAEAGHVFSRRYGPKVNVVRAPPQVIFQRLSQDLSQNTHSADVFTSVDIGAFVTLKQNGALLPYTPPNAADLLPPFRGLDKDGAFQATVASVIAIAYNTQKAPPQALPKRWTDLLDPAWRGKLALVDPAFSGFAGSWAVLMQKLYGRSFFERLQKQDVQVRRSPNDAAALVASGERLVTAAPIFAILEQADKGEPLGIIYPADGAILVATPSGILKSAPHPNAAKLFMEFLLGPEFGEILVRARYESTRADVKPLPGVKPVTDIKLIRPSIPDVTKGVPQVSGLWRDIFGK